MLLKKHSFVSYRWGLRHFEFCVSLQRTSKSTWQSEPPEIWVTGFLNKKRREQVKERIYEQKDLVCYYYGAGSVCLCVCVGVCERRRPLTTVEHRFHIKALWQKQIWLPFEGLGGRNKMHGEEVGVCDPDPGLKTHLALTSNSYPLFSSVPGSTPGSQIWPATRYD